MGMGMGMGMRGRWEVCLPLQWQLVRSGPPDLGRLVMLWSWVHRVPQGVLYGRKQSFWKRQTVYKPSWLDCRPG